uniref:Uncharacterized protein n=1 Tax=Arundo donax TaxID=35708 RepID=A0A0A9DDW9_ARUDO
MEISFHFIPYHQNIPHTRYHPFKRGHFQQAFKILFILMISSYSVNITLALTATN